MTNRFSRVGRFFLIRQESRNLLSQQFQGFSSLEKSQLRLFCVVTRNTLMILNSDKGWLSTLDQFTKKNAELRKNGQEKVFAVLKFVSFDVGETLMDYTYLDYVWNEIIPQLYARKKGLSIEEAKEYVLTRYDSISNEDIRWYLPEYWFRHFNLDEDPTEVFKSHIDKIKFYPEVPVVLESLSQKYELVIASITPKNINEVILESIRHFFKHIFSPISDLQQVKKTAKFYGMICKVLEINSSAIVHVGNDWHADFIAPRIIGIRSFFLDRTGERSGKFIVKNLRQLQERLSHQ